SPRTQCPSSSSPHSRAHREHWHGSPPWAIPPTAAAPCCRARCCSPSGACCRSPQRKPRRSSRTPRTGRLQQRTTCLPAPEGRGSGSAWTCSSSRYSPRGRAAGSSCSSLGYHVGLQQYHGAVAIGGRVVAAGEDPVHGFLGDTAATAAVLGRAGAGTQAQLVEAVAQAEVLDVVLRRTRGLVVGTKLVGGGEPAITGQCAPGTGRSTSEHVGRSGTALRIIDAGQAASGRVVAALDADHPAVAAGQHRVSDCALRLAQRRLGLLERQAAVEHV